MSQKKECYIKECSTLRREKEEFKKVSSRLKEEKQEMEQVSAKLIAEKEQVEQASARLKTIVTKVMIEVTTHEYQADQLNEEGLTKVKAIV